MNKLIIFWGDMTSPYFRWYQAGTGHLEHEAEVIPALQSQQLLKEDLAVLASMAKSGKVELVLSASDIHINQVEMPGKAIRHLRKAVPYLLEEQIADPIDKLFIAVGDKNKAGAIPVRGINAEYLQQLIEQFAQAEIVLSKICVDLDLLVKPEVGYCLVLLADQVLAVDDKGKCWSCAQEDFFWLVQKDTEPQEEDIPLAVPMRIVCEDSELYTLFTSQLPAGRFAPEMRLETSVEEYLVEQKQPGINLLQGEFEVRETNSPLKQVMIKVASLFALVLCAHLLYQGSQIMALEAQKQSLDREKEALWSQAFPSRKMPDNEDKVLRSYLKDADSSTDAAFLALLQSTVASLGNLEQVYPTNISFDASKNELRLDVIAKDLAVLNQYRDELTKSGHQVEQSSATQRGDGYSSRLIVSK